MLARSGASTAWQRTFVEAVGALRSEDAHLFENVTRMSLSALVDETSRLGADSLRRVLDFGGRDGKLVERGNLYHHPLNAKGLHVLKWMMARRIVDANRIARGWRAHPEYGTWMRHGILTRKLHHWRPDAESVPLTESEMQLLGLATGRASVPFTSHAFDPSRADSTRESGIHAAGNHTHRFDDSDPQYQLHIDVFLPNVKLMVFAEASRIEAGPFHYVPGSHRISAQKLRWLWERTRGMTAGGSQDWTRHVNVTAWQRGDERGVPPGERWCTASHACLRHAYRSQQRDLSDSYGFPSPSPIVVEAGSLVIADTSGFHFRGLGRPGGRRATMAYLQRRAGAPSRPHMIVRGGLGANVIVQVPRVPVLLCGNASHPGERLAQASCREWGH